MSFGSSAMYIYRQHDYKGQSVIRSRSLGELALFLPQALTSPVTLQHLLFEVREAVLGQCPAQRLEEAQVVGRVVEHEQHARQQLIGHQQVVYIRPLVVAAAVARTAGHERTEVFAVSAGCEKKRLKAW